MRKYAAITPHTYVMEGDPVGKGTYGTVWKGQCLETKEPVAMKKVDLRFEKEGLPTTCVREIRALRRLSDALEEEKKTKGPGLEKNVVRLLDIWTEKPAGSLVGDTYLVFEYVHHDLTGYVHYRGRKLLLQEVRCLGIQMCRGLLFCHEQGIMHRDLKPSNILLTQDGIVKLCDFGLSRTFHNVDPGPYTYRVITLWYRPPELHLNADKYDPSVDIWSMGCIIAELITGRPVFADGNSDIQMLRSIRTKCGFWNRSQWPEALTKLPGFDSGWKVFSKDQAPADHVSIYEQASAGGRVQGAKRRCPQAGQLLKETICLDPARRIDAAALANHQFWTADLGSCQPGELKMPPATAHFKELGVSQRQHQREARADQDVANDPRRKRPQQQPVAGPTPKRQRAP